MTVNEIWPASDEFQWASLTETGGRNLTTYTTVKVAVLPTENPLTNAALQAPLAVDRPNTSTIRAQLKVDTDALPSAVTKFNIWIQIAGGGETISRVAGQLKRPRF